MTELISKANEHSLFYSTIAVLRECITKFCAFLLSSVLQKHMPNFMRWLVKYPFLLKIYLFIIAMGFFFSYDEKCEIAENV